MDAQKIEKIEKVRQECKDTVDRLLTDIRKVVHSMIDQDYISQSPMHIIKDALKYIDEEYTNKK